MAKKFRDLVAQMPQERQARIAAETQRLIDEMPSQALRRALDLTQQQVAASPGIVTWVTPPGSLDLVVGETARIPVTLRNGGAFAWTPNVDVVYRWRNAAGAEVPTSYSSDSASGSSEGARPAAPVAEGTLASDEALAALREKLTGN